MARLYSNENFPAEVVNSLRAPGHDVLTAAEAGNANLSIPDGQVIAYAVEAERALLTLNRWDFVRLHQRVASHAGIIACTQDTDTGGQADRIHVAIEREGDLRGKLIRINRPQRT
jgi:hypothetical protein